MLTIQQTAQAPAFLYVDDVLRLMRISRALAYKLVRQNDFPKIRVGGRIVIPQDLFEEWIRNAAHWQNAVQGGMK